MSILNLDTNPGNTIAVTVRESDTYTETAYVSFERQSFQNSTRGCDEMFLTPTQLETMGRFFIRQADEIRTAQSIRSKTELSL